MREHAIVKREPATLSPRPFVKWAGGKSRLLPELLPRLPKHYKRYFEPFLGGGALFFALSPKGAVLADVNEELVNVYLVIQERVEELIVSLSQHSHNEEYFYQVREADRSPEYASWSPVERASRFIFLNRTCYNGLYRVNSKGLFNVPFGDYANPTICDAGNLAAGLRQVLLQSTCHLFPSLVSVQGNRDLRNPL
jgi:DNA adenine methylase